MNNSLNSSRLSRLNGGVGLLSSHVGLCRGRLQAIGGGVALEVRRDIYPNLLGWRSGQQLPFNFEGRSPATEIRNIYLI